MAASRGEEGAWLIYARPHAAANVRCGSPAYATATLKHLSWLISAWHDEIDRRTRLVDADYAKECALEGMARTQVIWLKEGLVKV